MSMADQDYATVSGMKVHKSDFAYAPEGSNPSEWKLPIHDAAHVRNALARFNQTELPAAAKAAARSKILARAHKHGIDTSGFEREHAASEGYRFAIPLGDLPSEGLVKLPVALTGRWVHPGTKQEIDITRAKLETAVRNFHKKANGEINVDYDHASAIPNFSGGPRPSAGRILSLAPPEPFTDRKGKARLILYGHYEPTDMARGLIAKKEYRFISPVLDEGRVDKATGERQGMTITTVALTNTPVLEELPQIQLAETGFVDVGNGNELADARNSMSEGGTRNMAEKQLTMKCAADGTHEVFDGDDKVGTIAHAHLKQYVKNHVEPDADDVQASEGVVIVTEAGHRVAKLDPNVERPAEERFAQYLSDIGFEGSTPEQVKGLLAAGARAAKREKQEASRQLLLTEVIAGGYVDTVKASEFLASGKLLSADFKAGMDAQARVERAIRDGRLLPRKRGEAIRLCLSEEQVFKSLVEEGVPVINLKPRGAAAGASGDPTQDFLTLVNARAAEKQIEYQVALSEITREHPDLYRQYSEAVTRKTAQ
jgi:phage I-like protein